MTRPEAARQNGAKSQGPITPAGKAISSRNATTHGLFSQPIVPAVMLENETGDAQYSLLAAAVAKYQPQDRLENEDIVTFVSLHLRYRRSMELETAAVNDNLSEEAGISEALRTQLAFAQAHDDSAFFANLSLYESRLQRACEKAQRRLDTMHVRRAELALVQSVAQPPAPAEAVAQPPAPAEAEAQPPIAIAAETPRKNEPAEAPPSASQIPRNAKCPCGSGAKFRRCCKLRPKQPLDKAA